MGEGDSGSYDGLLIGGDNNVVENNQDRQIQATFLFSFGGNNVSVKE